MTERRAHQLVILLADVSGDTRFMVQNQLSAIHGQLSINMLIEALLREVDIPLRLQEIEGDAVFLYATDPGADRAWQAVLAELRFGTVRTYVHLMAEATERMRDSFCAMEPAALASRGRRYARMSLRPHFSAVIDQLRHRSVSAGWTKHVAFSLEDTIASPLVFVTLLFTTPRKLLAQRAVRAATGAAQNPAA